MGLHLARFRIILNLLLTVDGSNGSSTSFVGEGISLLIVLSFSYNLSMYISLILQLFSYIKLIFGPCII